MAAQKSPILFVVFILALLGLLVVFEASATESLDIFGNKYRLTQQQGIWMAIGSIVFLLTSKIPTRFWQVLAPVIYGVGLIGLFAVFIPGVGVEVNGATRWISLFGVRFQPVEIMKLGLVTYFPVWLQKHHAVIPFLILMLVPVILTLLQPDLGSTLILLSISFGLFILTQPSLKHLVQLSAAGILCLTLLVIFSPYRRERLMTYLNPSSDPHGEGYHMRQIRIALGNGGLWGMGPGKSMQKYRYIPELSTDSIFSLIAEEGGFLGSLVFIGFLIFFLSNCFDVVQKQSPGSPEYLLSAGISIWLASQIIINLSAVVALIPLTGIPLPFISRGGTALVTMFAILGILIHLDQQKNSSIPKLKSTSSPRYSRSFIPHRKTYTFRRKK